MQNMQICSLGEPTGFQADSFLEELPMGLRAEVMMYLYSAVLSKIPLFRECNPRFVEAIALRLKTQVGLPYEFIFKEGDRSREMYFIREGVVEIIKMDLVTGENRVIARVGADSDDPFFGEISLLLGETRTASIRAYTKCVFSYLTQDDFFDVLSLFPEEESSLR